MKKRKQQLVPILSMLGMGLLLTLAACTPTEAAVDESPQKMRCLNESSFPEEGKGASMTEEQAKANALENLHKLAEENAQVRCKLHKCNGENCVRDTPVKIKEEPITVTKIVDKEDKVSFEAGVKATVTYDCGCTK